MAGLKQELKEQRIMVAVDESKESMHALSWCLNNLVPTDAHCTFVLLYVQPPPPVYSSLDVTGYLFSGDVLAAMEKYSKDLTDSVMERATTVYQNFHNVQVEKKVGSGDARDVICSMVETLGVDLLVMGSHGYGSLERVLLGSVSDYCAKNANCPVLIVRRPKA